MQAAIAVAIQVAADPAEQRAGQACGMVVGVGEGNRPRTGWSRSGKIAKEYRVRVPCKADEVGCAVGHGVAMSPSKA